MIELLIQIILLVVGFAILIKGSDIFVSGSSNIATILKIPTLVVGLTIVAFGTSAPEAAVSISSSIQGSNALAVSNVIGSNIFNILGIIGVCALLKELKLGEEKWTCSSCNTSLDRDYNAAKNIKKEGFKILSKELAF